MKKNLLHRMLIREIIKHRMQFVMLTVLCALGSFSYVGLDETGKMVRETIDQYFEEKNLADFWIQTLVSFRHSRRIELKSGCVIGSAPVK